MLTVLGVNGDIRSERRARCHLVRCGTVILMQSATQSAIAKFFSRSHDAVIRGYDAAGNVIETHEQAGEFNEP